MSYVTNMILCTLDEQKGVDEINDILKNDPYRVVNCRQSGTFVKIDSYTNGIKYMEGDVYIYAGNYVLEEEFIELFRSIDWEISACCQLFVKGQGDEIFTVYSADGDEK